MEFTVEQLSQIAVRREQIDGKLKALGIPKVTAGSPIPGYAVRIAGSNLEVMIVNGKGKKKLTGEGMNEWRWEAYSALAEIVTDVTLIPGYRLEISALGNEVAK